MIRLEPFKREHVAMLVDPKNEPGLAKTIKDRPEYWDAMEKYGIAFSAFNGDSFLGCAGIAVVWPGVAEGWVWALPTVDEVPLQLHYLVRRAIRFLEKEHNLKRLSVEVRRGNDRAARWVRALGFVYEGDMKKRGPDGETHMLYARVKE